MCYLNVYVTNSPLKRNYFNFIHHAPYEYLKKKTCTHKASTKAPTSSCGHGEWQCTSDECINIDFVCDGTPDCIDNSDEGSLCNINKGKFKSGGKLKTDRMASHLSISFRCF